MFFKAFDLVDQPGMCKPLMGITPSPSITNGGHDTGVKDVATCIANCESDYDCYGVNLVGSKIHFFLPFFWL